MRNARLNVWFPTQQKYPPEQLNRSLGNYRGCCRTFLQEYDGQPDRFLLKFSLVNRPQGPNSTRTPSPWSSANFVRISTEVSSAVREFYGGQADLILGRSLPWMTRPYRSSSVELWWRFRSEQLPRSGSCCAERHFPSIRSRGSTSRRDGRKTHAAPC
jgi:hypothetical protein